MSQKSIKILPESLVNIIAAGEVIERPSSVLKELVENALDAGSSRITVRFEDGGRRRVQVSDDGSGMSEHDALLAIERHATSKIAEVDDLVDIKTMGFRGEALPSIASIGKFELRTWDGRSPAGTSIKINNGILSRVEPCAMSRGTRVSLSHIFEKLPARRKFMRSRETETSWCLRTFEEMAMTRPEIHFEITGDSGSKTVYPAVASVRERVSALWGAEEAGTLLELEGEKGGVRLEGLVSPPWKTYARRNRQYVMVNGRPVRDPAINRVISAALSMSYPHGRFPAIVLSVHIPHGGVDVNVHPSKKEVRIREIGLLTEALKESVRGLGTGSSPVHAYKNRPGREDIPKAVDRADEKSTTPEATSHPPSVPITEPDNADLPIEEGERVIGQYMGTYILVQKGPDLQIIDQHAAHERILFNDLMSSRKERDMLSQPLVVPVVLDLSPSEIKNLMGKADLLESFGWMVEEFGDNAVRITAAPAELPSRLVHTFVRTLAVDLDELPQLPEEMALLISRWACRSSVTAGRRLTTEEMNTLVRDLRLAESGFACPHGRPTSVSIAPEEVEKLFGRR